MNHDYAHCDDYNPDICPASCFRGQLVRDYREQGLYKPVSWMHLKDTDECRAYRRRPTNADVIRGMTDEELAEWECDRSCSLCPFGDCEGRMEEGRKKCKQRWLEWLKQEVDDAKV